MKTQPANISGSLWRRFLIKKGYNGVYNKHGIKVYILHTSSGIFEVTGGVGELINK